MRDNNGKFFADWDDPVFDGPPDMLDRTRKLVKHIIFSVFDKPFYIRVERDCKNPGRNGRVFLQLGYHSPCGKTGEDKDWHGRKWYLSPHMLDDEIIKTCYLAFETAVKHEVMEGFRFDGKPIFNPHIDFNELLKISDKEVKR